MGTKIRVVTEGKASDFEISASGDFVISEEEVLARKVLNSVTSFQSLFLG